MQLISPDTQAQVAAVVARITTSMKAELERTIDAEINQAEEFRRAYRQQSRLKRAQNFRKDAKYTKRISQAHRGITNLLALGKIPQVQALIKLRTFGESPDRDDLNGVSFYAAFRPDGKAWRTKGEEGHGSVQVEIALSPNGLHVLWGEFDREPPEFLLRYDEDTGAEGVEDVIETLLSMLYTPVGADPAKAANERQWEYEWEPEHVAFQVLRDCADPAKCEWYLREALKALK